MAEHVVGEIRMLANSRVPDGWASCDGQILQIRKHKALFAVLGTAYGGDGRSTFALPDLRGRIPVHSNPGVANIGKAGGEKSHAIRTSEIPDHAHGSLRFVGRSQAQSGAQLVATTAPGASLAASATLSVPSTETHAASADGHNNLQPYLTVSFIIALAGA